jgi:hypothetical protein
MARRARVHVSVVQDKILDMNQLTGDPHRPDRIEEMTTLRKPLPDRRAGRPLVQSRQTILCLNNGRQ